MIIEERKATFKHFVFVILAACIIVFVGAWVRYAVPTSSVIVDIMSIILFIVAGCFVYTHYTPVFEYKIDGYTLYVKRSIGRRNVKDIQIKSKQIISVEKCRPPQIRKIYNMCVSIYSKTNIVYVVYKAGTTQQAVKIEASVEFLDKLCTLTNETED